MKETLDVLLERGIADGAAPGVSATVVSRDSVLWEGAWGLRSLGSETAMTFDTVGRIFSMTKAITAAAAMQLVEKGALKLDSPAGDVCPWIHEVKVLEGFSANGEPILRPPASPVTLLQLLTHTSGFVYEMWNENDARCKEQGLVPSLFSAQKAALRAPLAFDPGTKWEYGIGLDWAGQMVEAVSGLSLGEYFSAHITGPLGMTDTAFAPTPSMAERAAGLHARTSDDSLTPMELPAAENPEFEMGGGGLLGTMGDYGRFLRMILNDGELDGTRVLKPETVAMMCENQIGDLRVRPLETLAPALSRRAEFFPGSPKSWGLSFQINEEPADTGRPAGTLMWAGLANSFYWIDRKNDLAGAYLSQILPFADEKSLGLFFDLERTVYEHQQNPQGIP